ncbi:MAG: formate/nitrite transporter family protein [Anaerolineales bacterium]|nr:formate/nitrite transporter family protein [Anaerolineales bacterium]MCK4978402.1 formate/nitrite transporter family protein [Anaerolineales bacterium]MCK5315010.1 formate/nitrite transporter family protein [Anaerolineales bacterium]
MASELRIDALLPPEMARRAEYLGVLKAETPKLKMFALSVLAGAFIALGAVFATTVATGAAGVLTYGVTKMLVGLVFCLGLILVIVGGAELFTGNNLIIMAWAGRKVTSRALFQNWVIVYIGNFFGALGTAILVLLSKQYTFASGALGQTALNIANSKIQYEFGQALVLGILCNILVCLAVWLTYSARTTIDKIAAIIFPIAAFVAAGFEHSIANMYFIPIGLLIKYFDPAYTASTGLDLSGLTWSSFITTNLIPVTIGNIIGGSFFVAVVYWAIFLRRSEV